MNAKVIFPSIETDDPILVKAGGREFLMDPIEIAELRDRCDELADALRTAETVIRALNRGNCPESIVQALAKAKRKETV